MRLTLELLNKKDVKRLKICPKYNFGFNLYKINCESRKLNKKTLNDIGCLIEKITYNNETDISIIVYPIYSIWNRTFIDEIKLNAITKYLKITNKDIIHIKTSDRDEYNNILKICGFQHEKESIYKNMYKFTKLNREGA